MSIYHRFLVLGLISLFTVGCGSGDDSADSGIDLSGGQPAPTASRPKPSSSQQPARPKPTKPTKEELLDRDIGDIIVHLERGNIETVVNEYIDPAVLNQVKVHDATFAEKKSLQKLYDGFRDDIAKDLLANLKACQSLDPEILAQDDATWYSATFFDDATMTSEVTLMLDPKVDKNWYLNDLPLTLPWGEQQAQGDEWKQWEAVATDGKRIRDLSAIDFDPHANPATVVLGMRKSFQQVLGPREHDLRSYGNLLLPDSRKIHAAVLVKSIMLSKEFAPRVKEVVALIDRFGFNRDGMDKLTYPPSTDIAFYSAFAQRFPEGTDFIGFIEQASALYEDGKGKKFSIHYPFQGSNPQPKTDGDLVEAMIEWNQIDSSHKPTMKTRFKLIGRKWFVESYWEALARKEAAGQ